MGVVIVAIPSSDDRVWSVSSEKKPHLTLLYLGDDVSPEVSAQIVQFVEHAAATVLNRFYLEIDKRGTLGKDNADVVFFEGWDLPDLKRFRSYLLMDNTIKKTYLAAEQFPDWLPHLTLGYPTKPAKKLKDDGDRLYSIHFDKIAVWFGDFGGPEFELKKYEHPEVAMSAASPAVENILRHYGVKGMKWGRRKDAPAPGTVRVTDKKKKLKAEGGKGFETHPDAVKAATSKQKLKKSGTKTLSNNELRDLATRLNLEKQVRELSVADKQANSNRAARFVKGLLKNSGKQEAQKASNSLASKGVETLMKK